MMSSTLGAPLGGTTRGGQYGFEFLALSLITPPNFIGGGGICFPSIVTVALGEPGTPVILLCPLAAGTVAMTAAAIIQHRTSCLVPFILSSLSSSSLVYLSSQW